MYDKRFVPFLTELAQKYSVVKELSVVLEDGSVLVRCEKGDLRFVHDFGAQPQPGDLPLFHWRNKRRYIELRNIVEQKLVEKPLALRIHHIVPPDGFTRSLEDILVMETDLLEFITGQKVRRVFADLSGRTYTNCIFSTDGNIKASLELGFSPEGSEPVLLHEVVARRGIASDVAVDTQTQQYPIYVFKGPQTEHYTDIDQELYGLDNTQADCIRAILAVLMRPESAKALQEQWTHLRRVCQAVERSSRELNYTEVEG